MKISEVVEALKKYQDKYGDLPVRVSDDKGYSESTEVEYIHFSDTPQFVCIW